MAFQSTSNGVTNDSNTRTLLLDCSGTPSSYPSSGLFSSSSSPPSQRTIIPIQLPVSGYDPNVSYAIILPRSTATDGNSLYPSTSVLSSNIPGALVPIPVAQGGSDSQFDAFMSQFDDPADNLNQTTNIEMSTNPASVALSRHLMSDPTSTANTDSTFATDYEQKHFSLVTSDVFDIRTETTSYTPIPTTSTTISYDDGNGDGIDIESPTTTFENTSPYHTADTGSGTGANSYTAVESDGKSQNRTSRERRGNSGASARFRERRREREKDTAAALEKARSELQELGIRIQELKAENKLLREILSMNERQKSKT